MRTHNNPNPPLRGWGEWTVRWRDPAVLLALASAFGAAGTWGVGMAMDQTQLIGRVATLEKRSDEQSLALSRFQEQIAQKVETLDVKVNQFSLQLATLSPRLDGVYELLRNMKETQSATDQRIIDANRARDEAARLRDAEWGRRFDSLTIALRGPDRR